jgi:hypothetical protein
LIESTVPSKPATGEKEMVPSSWIVYVPFPATLSVCKLQSAAFEDIDGQSLRELASSVAEESAAESLLSTAILWVAPAAPTGESRFAVGAKGALTTNCAVAV